MRAVALYNYPLPSNRLKYGGKDFTEKMLLKFI